jgi:hypothetical protein
MGRSWRWGKRSPGPRASYEEGTPMSRLLLPWPLSERPKVLGSHDCGLYCIQRHAPRRYDVAERNRGCESMGQPSELLAIDILHECIKLWQTSRTTLLLIFMKVMTNLVSTKSYNMNSTRHPFYCIQEFHVCVATDICRLGVCECSPRRIPVCVAVINRCCSCSPRSVIYQSIRSTKQCSKKSANF